MPHRRCRATGCEAVAVLGYPLHGPDGAILGTICALHHQPFDFDAGSPSLRDQLVGLQRAIEADLGATVAA